MDTRVLVMASGGLALLALGAAFVISFQLKAWSPGSDEMPHRLCRDISRDWIVGDRRRRQRQRWRQVASQSQHEWWRPGSLGRLADAAGCQDTRHSDA